jgi:hypothetical protein
VDEAEERQHRAGAGEERRPLELAVDDKDRYRAEDQAGEHGAAAEQRHAVINHAGGAQFDHADLVGRSAGGGERPVDQGLGPGGDVRQNRQDDRRTAHQDAAHRARVAAPGREPAARLLGGRQIGQVRAMALAGYE